VQPPGKGNKGIEGKGNGQERKEGIGRDKKGSWTPPDFQMD